MRSGTIAWFLGTCAVHGLPVLPDLWWGPLFCVSLVFLVRPGRLRLPLCFLAGFLLTGWTAQATIGDRPAQDFYLRDVRVHGTVVGIPRADDRSTRFDLRPDRIRVDGEIAAVGGRWRLRWYEEGPILVPGQRWQLDVRLKTPPRSHLHDNFDYQKYLFRNGISAVGYVRNSGATILLEESAARPSLDRLRARLTENIRAALSGAHHSGVVTALTVGVRDGISSTTRALLHRTGTSHLMAISGLHVAIAASLGFLIGRCGWHLLGRFRQVYPAPKVAALGALCTAIAYAGLAGFSLPTQRALVMLAVGVLALLTDRGKTASQVYCWALLAVLLWDPLSPLDGGFWLSFGAVAALLLAYGTKLRMDSASHEWLRTQALLAVALLPLTVKLFEVVNFATLPANLIAVPWAALMVVPPALFGGLAELVAPGLGTWPWRISELAFGALWEYLVWLDGLDLRWAVQPPTTAVLGCTLVGVVLLLMPKGFPGRWLGLVCIVVLFVPEHPKRPEAPELILFETGQGYSALFLSPQRTLVFDPGPRYGDGTSFADTVLVPYLESRGVRHVDWLVISRPLTTRAGGSRALLGSFKVKSVLVAKPEAVPLRNVDACGDAPIARLGELTLRVERMRGEKDRCRLLVTWNNREIAVLDPDADNQADLSAVNGGLSIVQTGNEGLRGFLGVHEYRLDGPRLTPVSVPIEDRVRYWHY